MSDSRIIEIQTALHTKGFSPGKIDGVWGRQTIAAIKDFQRSNGLKVDGIIGPKTTFTLFGADEHFGTSMVLPWMAEAKNLLDTKEVLGRRSNPKILDWAFDLEIKYLGDDVPWCGLFVAHCIGSTLLEESLPTNPLGARRWQSFGEKIKPRTGAIMVFWRGSKEGGKGHVGFYTGEDNIAYRILGGNQSDKVCFTWIGKNRFIDARWPETASSLNIGTATVMMDREKDVLISDSDLS